VTGPADRTTVSTAGGAADGGHPVVRITWGGATTPLEQVAIVTAVSRALASRDRARSAAPSTWALAGRLEASGATTVRARSSLPRT
jgi:hypothetical protein